MRYALIILALFLGCKRDKAGSACTQVTITDSAPPCRQWGINVNGQVYPSKNIPDSFRQNGKPVCADFVLYQDMALCPCCGGTFANIISMQ